MSDMPRETPVFAVIHFDPRRPLWVFIVPREQIVAMLVRGFDRLMTEFAASGH
jgi:hypothetical protein